MPAASLVPVAIVVDGVSINQIIGLMLIIPVDCYLTTGSVSRKQIGSRSCAGFGWSPIDVLSHQERGCTHFGMSPAPAQSLHSFLELFEQQTQILTHRVMSVQICRVGLLTCPLKQRALMIHLSTSHIHLAHEFM